MYNIQQLKKKIINVLHFKKNLILSRFIPLLPSPLILVVFTQTPFLTASSIKKTIFFTPEYNEEQDGFLFQVNNSISRPAITSEIDSFFSFVYRIRPGFHSEVKISTGNKIPHDKIKKEIPFSWFHFFLPRLRVGVKSIENVCHKYGFGMCLSLQSIWFLHSFGHKDIDVNVNKFVLHFEIPYILDSMPIINNKISISLVRILFIFSVILYFFWSKEKL